MEKCMPLKLGMEVRRTVRKPKMSEKHTYSAGSQIRVHRTTVSRLFVSRQGHVVRSRNRELIKKGKHAQE